MQQLMDSYYIHIDSVNGYNMTFTKTTKEIGSNHTCLRSRVMVTQLYFAPLVRVGLCHQEFLPFMALVMGCRCLSSRLLASQMSQCEFLYGKILTWSTSLQNTSLFSSPQVALTLMVDLVAKFRMFGNNPISSEKSINTNENIIQHHIMVHVLQFPLFFGKKRKGGYRIYMG